MTAPKLFGRRCRVTVDTLGVESLRVGFTIEKSLKAREPNKVELAIYNLARRTREQVEKSESGIPVEIFAGYDESGVSLLFRGELREAFSKPDRDGSWVTVIRSGDGDRALRGARSTRGSRPGVSIERVINDLANDLGTGLGNVAKAVKDQLVAGDLSLDGLGTAFVNGLNGTGSAAEQLDRMLKSVGLEWSIQDGEIQAMPLGSTPQQKVTVVSPYSGLEGTPEREGKGKVSFRCRILPDLMPGFLVQLQSAGVSGLYKIQKVRFVGDTHGADWTAEIEANELTGRGLAAALAAGVAA